MSNKDFKTKLFFYARLIFGFALLAFVFTLVDLAELRRTLAYAKPAYLALGLLAILANFSLMTYRWATIVWVQRPDVSYSQLLRLHFVSGFLGNFASVSPDIIKLYLSSKQISDPKGAFSTIFLDRVGGVLALGTVTLAAYLVFKHSGMVQVGPMISSGILIVLVLCIGGPLALQADIVIRIIRRMLGWFRWSMLNRVAALYDNLLSYQNQRAIMLKVLLIAFANQLMYILIYYIIAWSFSANVSIVLFFLFVPLVEFMTAVPVSVGGMGVLEGTFVYLFSSVGMTVETCVSIVLCRRLLLFAAFLPGGVIYSFDGLAAKRLPT